EKWGTRLGLSVGVFGTLGMHSPKVPHPDFSVKVIGHNLKILWLWKTSEAEKALGTMLRKSLDRGSRNAQPRKSRRLGQPVRGATYPPWHKAQGRGHPQF